MCVYVKQDNIYNLYVKATDTDTHVLVLSNQFHHLTRGDRD